MENQSKPSAYMTNNTSDSANHTNKSEDSPFIGLRNVTTFAAENKRER